MSSIHPKAQIIDLMAKNYLQGQHKSLYGLLFYLDNSIWTVIQGLSLESKKGVYQESIQFLLSLLTEMTEENIYNFESQYKSCLLLYLAQEKDTDRIDA